VNRTLYDIDFDIDQCFDQETGEILDYSRLKELEIEREHKIEGVACYIKNLTAEADGIKAEIDSLTARKKAKEKKIEGLKGWLEWVLGGARFETPKASIGWRKSTKVNVFSEHAVPEEFLKVKTEVTPDKTEIKKALQAGINVPGCELEETNNIQIK
jgi:hypothetical protein